MGVQHHLLRWFLSELDPKLWKVVAELYVEQSTKLSLKGFLFYFIAKLLWLLAYSSSGLKPTTDSGGWRFHADSAKWRTMTAQLIQLLVLASMLGVTAWRHRLNLPMRMPRPVLCLPAVLAIASATLHVESIRHTIDGRVLSIEGKAGGQSCQDLVTNYYTCLEHSTDFFLQRPPNASQSYHLAYRIAGDACSKVPPTFGRTFFFTGNGIREACSWRCFDPSTLLILTLEFIAHLLVLLPAELCVLLVLPLWLIFALPTATVCGPRRWVHGLTFMLDFSKGLNPVSVASSGSPWTLFATCLFCVCVSCIRGRLQLEVAKHMTLARKEAVHEKVKRCEAEFQMELSKSESARQAAMLSYDQLSLMTSQQQSEHYSNWTAPAALLSTGGLQDSCNMCASGDCLPENYLVQVEDIGSLVPLSQLQLDRQILCYDHILQTSRYVRVTELVHGEASSAEWLQIELADGAIMFVTSDHPMKTKLRDSNRLPVATTPACKLRPGEHTIACIRPTQVGVKSIKPCPTPSEAEQGGSITRVQGSENGIDDASCLQQGQEVHVDNMFPTQQGPMTAGDLPNLSGHRLAQAFPLGEHVSRANAPSRRVKLGVWQGDRFAVLVKTPNSRESPTDWAAVGSANASLDAGKLYVELDTLRRSHHRPQLLRRSHSDPAILALDSYHGLGFGQTRKSELSESSANTSDAQSSEISATFRLPCEGALVLSEHKKLGALGQNRGSHAHPDGCQPCKWHFRHAGFRSDLASGRSRPKACVQGALCDYCHHDDHLPDVGRLAIFSNRKRREVRREKVRL